MTTTQLILSAGVLGLSENATIRTAAGRAVLSALANVVDELRGLSSGVTCGIDEPEPWQTTSISQADATALVCAFLTLEVQPLTLHRRVLELTTTDDGCIDVLAQRAAITHGAVVASIAERLRREPELPASVTDLYQALAAPFGMVTVEQINEAISLVTATQAADFEQYKAEHQPDA